MNIKKLVVLMVLAAASAGAEQRHVAVVGDSNTMPAGGASPVCVAEVSCNYPGIKWVEQFAAIRPNWLVTNHAIAGMPAFMPGFLPHCQYQAAMARQSGATDLVIACGSNDLILGATAAETVTRILNIKAAWEAGGGDPGRVWVATIPPAFTPNPGCRDYTDINVRATAANASLMANPDLQGRIIRRDLVVIEDYRYSVCYDPAGVNYEAHGCACFDGLHPGDGRPWDPVDGAQMKWARALMEAIQ